MKRIRWIALLTAALLLFALLPAAALAEGAPVRIGTVEYPTLDEAVAAAEDGAVIELLADCTSSGMNLSKNLTIRGVEGTPRRITFTGAGIALWGKSLTFETCAVDMTGVGKTPYAEWSWMTICASKNAELSLKNAAMTLDGTGAGNAHAIYFCGNDKLNLTGAILTIRNYA